MKFDLDGFYRFCAELQIETKEDGLMKMTQESMLGTQTYTINEIAKGLEDDIHYFVILKGRQQGITTVTLALDLYWHFIHPGLQGTLTTDTEENRDMFRQTLAMYMDGLPKSFKIPALAHNRNSLTLRNRSRLFYQVAGLRAKGNLGRGKAITYLHGTETSSWGDEEGLASLQASLAETNPNRLYIFESTARGFNMFEEMYTTAKKARTQKAIFCGWWLNQKYMADPEGAVYKTYWDGKLTPEEKEWTREVKKLYNYEINSRQVAWWRWKMEEGIKDNALMYQEFPPTEDYAFINTGSNFFSNSRCTDAYKEARKTQFDSWRYLFGNYFHDTEVIKGSEKTATLKVWEEPIDTAVYVIGADPAYGSSDWADRFCIQVYRCYADGMDQVAEFATSELNMYQFAWVLAHLAGAYKNSTVNLEINGPGQAVLQELKNLKRHATAIASVPDSNQFGKELMDVLSSMKNYIWRKNDTLNGLTNSIGWQTTSQTKERMMNYFKDYFERGMLIVRSTELIEEMKTIVRDGGTIHAPGRNKDDRAIATGLACAVFAEQVQPQLIMRRLTRDLSHKTEHLTAEEQSVTRGVSTYLQRIGYGRGR